jgi:glutamate:GABA antiporter
VILGLGAMAIAIVTPREDINLVSGLLDAFNKLFTSFHMGWMVPVIACFIIFGVIGELNAWIIAGVKGLFVTTENGLLPPIFHKTNKTYTPTNLLFFQAIIVTISALVFLYIPNVNLSYWVLSAFSSQMYLFVYILLFISVLVLRYRKPKVNRPYKIPGGNTGVWIISLVGIIATSFVLFVSFFPPDQIKIQHPFTYELLLLLGMAIIIAIPLLIYAFRKPHWKLEALKELREEIYRSTH